MVVESYRIQRREGLVALIIALTGICVQRREMWEGGSSLAARLASSVVLQTCSREQQLRYFSFRCRPCCDRRVASRYEVSRDSEMMVLALKTLSEQPICFRITSKVMSSPLWQGPKLKASHCCLIASHWARSGGFHYRPPIVDSDSQSQHGLRDQNDLGDGVETSPRTTGFKTLQVCIDFSFILRGDVLACCACSGQFCLQ